MSTDSLDFPELNSPCWIDLCPQRMLPYRSRTGGDYLTVCLTDARRQLEAIGDSWSELASSVQDPNVFYEPWFFLPAMDQLGSREQWRILLVYRGRNGAAHAPQLCGFFPFVKSVGPAWLPQWTLWRHPYCFLTTPLIRRGLEGDVLRAAWQHLAAAASDAHCVDFPLIAGDGPVHRGMIDVSRESLITSYTVDRFLRASVYTPDDQETYLKTVVGGHHLRELRRQRRRLESLGQLEYRVKREPHGILGWVDWFLHLEANGWKARAGTAIQLDTAHVGFFSQMIEAGARQNRIRFDGLFLNGEPIAMRCSLLRPPVCFAFKIAFDETYQKFSPGIQLELEYLRHLREDSSIQWSDSCAAPDHAMIDRIWSDRRVIEHVTLSTGKGLSEVVIGSLPLLRAGRRVGKRLFLQSPDPRAVSDQDESPRGHHR